MAEEHGPETADLGPGRELATAVVMFNHVVAQCLGLGSAEWRCLEL